MRHAGVNLRPALSYFTDARSYRSRSALFSRSLRDGDNATEHTASADANTRRSCDTDRLIWNQTERSCACVCGPWNTHTGAGALHSRSNPDKLRLRVTGIMQNDTGRWKYPQIGLAKYLGCIIFHICASAWNKRLIPGLNAKVRWGWMTQSRRRYSSSSATHLYDWQLRWRRDLILGGENKEDWHLRLIWARNRLRKWSLDSSSACPASGYIQQHFKTEGWINSAGEQDGRRQRSITVRRNN